MKKKAKARKVEESSSTYFRNLRPKFLDWNPPTAEEKALDVKARQEARTVELQRVTALAKDREAEKAAMTKRNRSAASRKEQRKRG